MARAAVVVLLGFGPSKAALAQGAHGGHTSGASGQVGAQAIGLVTRVRNGYVGRTFTEGYLTQPNVMGSAAFARGRLLAHGTLNLEGLTLERGELTTGTYGEGYMDRRHPHTYLHELVIGARATVLGAGVSLFAGKGFAPFGTDDPMVRPFAKYPVNHHLAQILERLVMVGAVRHGPVIVEAGLFNGDEPVGPGSSPKGSRFGDSWSARTTIVARRDVELAASYASVESPEQREGFGLDQKKWSVAARLSRSPEPPTTRVDLTYALVEWAHTGDYYGGRRVFEFESLLAEGTLAVGSRLSIASRFERTTRPEEERLLNVFRSPRPLADFNIIGSTRWNVVSLVARWGTVPSARVRLLPFIELSYLKPEQALKPSLFVPREFYGSTSIWNVSAGARFEIGHTRHRMGRYGVASGADR